MRRFRRWADADPRETLRLRDWTLAVLSTGTNEPAPEATEASWRLFLGIERCALSLSRAVSQGAGVLPEGAGREVLMAAAAEELKRSLAAAAEISRLDRIALETGWTIVILKAGRLVADGVPLFLHDVDVLLPCGLDLALARRLDLLGYERLTPDFQGRKHLGQRRLPSSIPLEIHSAVLGIREASVLIGAAVACEGTRSLRRLSDQHHLEHILIHAVVQHPDRQGRIRDATVLAGSLERLPHQERMAALAAAKARAGAAVDAWMALVDSLRQRNAPVDLFREAALYRYTLSHLAGGAPLIRHAVRQAARIGPPGKRTRAGLQDALALTTLGAPSRRLIVAVLRRIPIAGAALRAVGRVGRLMLACVLSRLSSMIAGALKVGDLRSSPYLRTAVHTGDMLPSSLSEPPADNRAATTLPKHRITEDSKSLVGR